MNIIIVDDDFFITTALKTILESDSSVQVQATGSSGQDAVRLYLRYRPDVLLMDIRMKEMDGLKAAEHILQADNGARILLLTTFLDDEYIIRALKLGAKGYLLKQDYTAILPALYAVQKGQTVFGNEITAKIPALIQKTALSSFSYGDYGITGREYELIRLVADGMSNREIADTLYLGEGTVRNYLSNILEKLSLRDRTQLAVFYYRHL